MSLNKGINGKCIILCCHLAVCIHLLSYFFFYHHHALNIVSLNIAFFDHLHAFVFSGMIFYQHFYSARKIHIWNGCDFFQSLKNKGKDPSYRCFRISASKSVDNPIVQSAGKNPFSRRVWEVLGKVLISNVSKGTRKGLLSAVLNRKNSYSNC